MPRVDDGSKATWVWRWKRSINHQSLDSIPINILFSRTLYVSSSSASSCSYIPNHILKCWNKHTVSLIQQALHSAMLESDLWLTHLIHHSRPSTLSSSFISFKPWGGNRRISGGVGLFRRHKRRGGVFLSVSLWVGKGDDGCVGESEEEAEEEVVFAVEKTRKSGGGGAGGGAMNTTKHLWAGAVAAMVSRFLFSSISLFWVKSFCLFAYGVSFKFVSLDREINSLTIAIWMSCLVAEKR